MQRYARWLSRVPSVHRPSGQTSSAAARVKRRGSVGLARATPPLWPSFFRTCLPVARQARSPPRCCVLMFPVQAYVCSASATPAPPTLSLFSFSCCPSGNRILMRPPRNRVHLRCTVPQCGRRPRAGHTATPEFGWHLTSMQSRGGVCDGMRAFPETLPPVVGPYRMSLHSDCVHLPSPSATTVTTLYQGRIYLGESTASAAEGGQRQRPPGRCLVSLGRTDDSVGNGRGICGLTQPPHNSAADVAPISGRERIERRQPWRRLSQQRRRGSVIRRPVDAAPPPTTPQHSPAVDAFTTIGVVYRWRSSHGTVQARSNAWWPPVPCHPPQLGGHSHNRNFVGVLSLFLVELQGWSRRDLRQRADQGPLQSYHPPAKQLSRRVIVRPPPALLPRPYFPSCVTPGLGHAPSLWRRVCTGTNRPPHQSGSAVAPPHSVQRQAGQPSTPPGT